MYSSDTALMTDSAFHILCLEIVHCLVHGFSLNMNWAVLCQEGGVASSQKFSIH